MAISSRLFCLLSVCIVGVWCTTNNTLFAPENATLITEVGRSVSILWEKRGPRPKEDILIKKGHQGTLARFAFGRPKKDEQGRVGVEIIGSVDTQFGIRMGNVKLDDSGSYFVQIEGSEMMSEAVLVVLGKPKKAEVNVSEGWACCTAESVTKPEKFRPPMKYSWNLISSEVETPININATCVNITHDIETISCYGFEEGGNLTSSVSNIVEQEKIEMTTTLNAAETNDYIKFKTAVRGNDKSITLIIVLAITIPTIMASLIAIFLLLCKFADLAINAKQM